MINIKFSSLKPVSTKFKILRKEKRKKKKKIGECTEKMRRWLKSVSACLYLCAMMASDVRRVPLDSRQTFDETIDLSLPIANIFCYN